LIGRTIRCPNNDCRLEFAVGVDAPPDDPPPSPVPKSPNRGQSGGTQWSGSVDDLIPMLPAETVEPHSTGDEGGSKHVSDMVPVVEAEAAPRDPVEVSWNQPPPVRGAPTRPASADPTTKKKVPSNGRGQKPAASQTTQLQAPSSRRTKIDEPETLLQYPDGPPSVLNAEPVAEVPAPVEVPPGNWESFAPPVRDGSEVAGPGPALAADSSTALSPEQAALAETKRKKRRSVVVMSVMVTFVVAAVLVGGYVVFGFIWQSESRRADLAYKEFSDGQYANASADFKDLQARYGKTSKRLDEFHSMEWLSGLLAQLSSCNTPEEMLDGLDSLGAIADTRKADPVVKQHIDPLRRTATRLLTGVLEAEANAPSDATPDRLTRVEAVLEKLTSFDNEVPGRGEDWTRRITEVRSAHDFWARHNAARGKVVALLGDASLKPVEAYKAVRTLLPRFEREFKGISDEPDVKAAFDGLYKRHFKDVYFEPPNAEVASTVPAVADLPGTTVVFDPRVDQRTPEPRPADDSVVLSLVRGVLYAHSRTTGEVLWLVRVGVDTNTLPLRVPETASSPERILVLRADSEMLAALDPGGREVWRYRLDSPCLGRPVVTTGGNSILLPTYEGYVHEVELAGGRPLGRWHLGQHLSGGGAIDRNANVAYFPAEDTCVYALNLDPKNRQCEAILYSNHPAGSLRGEPLVIAPREKSINGANQAVALPSFLILVQTDGLDATRMHIFSLPLADRTGPPISLDVKTRLPGWTWFTPYHDAEKVVAATDAGVVGVFGVKQFGNQDPELFTLVDTLLLDPLVKPESTARTRAQVVTARDEDLWVIAGGKMLRLAKTWTAADGPKLISRWPEPLSLGAPVHASQVLEDRATGQNTLIVVTQALKQRAYLATAVRDENGQKLWQRELGLVCHGAPILLRPGASVASNQAAAPADAAAAAAPVILTQGQSGEVFAIDPQRFANKKSKWLSAARSLVAGPLDDNPLKPPVLLAAADGVTAFEVAFPGGGHGVVVRRITLDPATRKASFQEQAVKLPAEAGPAGPPELVGDALVVPLTKGTVWRVPLSPIAATGKELANWRSMRIGADASGYVTALGPDTLVATDGGKGLTFWKISPEGVMSALFPSMDRTDDDAPALEFDDRVATRPLLVADAPDRRYLLLADFSGVLRKVKLTSKGAAEEVAERVDLKGRVSAGPFLRTVPGQGQRVGCVVEGNRLVWLDPAHTSKKLWEFKTPSGAEIVGEPEVVGGTLVVAERGGDILALDPATGKARGKGFSLPGSIAPAAPPVAFDGGNLFTPLSDGTVLLLPIDLFR
jgi:outer membrane protein assembly factor BamB